MLAVEAQLSKVGYLKSTVEKLLLKVGSWKSVVEDLLKDSC